MFKLSLKQRLALNAFWRWLRGERDTLLLDLRDIFHELEPWARGQVVLLAIGLLNSQGESWDSGTIRAKWDELRERLNLLTDTALAELRAKAIELAGGLK